MTPCSNQQLCALLWYSVLEVARFTDVVINAGTEVIPTAAVVEEFLEILLSLDSVNLA